MTHSSVKTLLLCGAASLSLGLGACKDKAEAGGSEAVSALSIDGLSASDIKARFEVEPRTVDAASANAALESLSLLEEGDGISWGSREGSEGTYTYTDIVLENPDDDTVVRISQLYLMGARMEGEEARFDKVVIDDLEASSEANDMSASVDALTLINPKMDSVAFLNGSGGSDGVPTADAMAVDGVDIKGRDDEADITLTLASMAFATQTANGAKDGFFTADDMAVSGTFSEGANTLPITMTLDSAQITDMTSLQEMQGMGTGGFGNALSNPYALPFKQASVEDFDMVVDGFSVDMDSVRMASEESNDAITVRSVMQPLTLKFESDPTSPEMVSLRDQLSKLGYDELVFTSESDSRVDVETDTVVSRGGHFTLEDGFRMEIDQDMRGVGAMQAAQRQAIADAGFAEIPGPEASESEQRRYSQTVLKATMDSLTKMELGEFVLRIDDNSIMERIFEFVAAEQGTSVKMLRAQAKSMLAFATMMGGETGVDAAIIQSAVEAVGEWIDNPGSTLVLGIDPEGYIPVTEIQGKDAAALGFSASVDK